MNATEAAALLARITPALMCLGCGARNPPTRAVQRGDSTVYFHEGCPWQGFTVEPEYVRPLGLKECRDALETILRLETQDAKRTRRTVKIDTALRAWARAQDHEQGEATAASHLRAVAGCPTGCFQHEAQEEEP